MSGNSKLKRYLIHGRRPGRAGGWGGARGWGRAGGGGALIARKVWLDESVVPYE